MIPTLAQRSHLRRAATKCRETIARCTELLQRDADELERLASKRSFSLEDIGTVERLLGVVPAAECGFVLLDRKARRRAELECLIGLRVETSAAIGALIAVDGEPSNVVALPPRREG